LIGRVVPDRLPPFVAAALTRRLMPEIDCGIAFVGCGGFVNYDHIPAYQASGFRLLGGSDINRAAAERTVQTHGLGRVFDSLGHLLAGRRVDVVDIAVLPRQQPGLVRQVAAGGKDVLYDYPAGRSDTLKFASRGANRSAIFCASLPGKWFTDAFYGRMALLMEIIQAGGGPVTLGEGYLGTLRVDKASYRSAAERRRVGPEEIAA
jgi:hypothetical protein